MSTIANCHARIQHSVRFLSEGFQSLPRSCSRFGVADRGGLGSSGAAVRFHPIDATFLQMRRPPRTRMELACGRSTVPRHRRCGTPTHYCGTTNTNPKEEQGEPGAATVQALRCGDPAQLAGEEQCRDEGCFRVCSENQHSVRLKRASKMLRCNSFREPIWYYCAWVSPASVVSSTSMSRAPSRRRRMRSTATEATS